jgi:hypothetical protein
MHAVVMMVPVLVTAIVSMVIGHRPSIGAAFLGLVALCFVAAFIAGVAWFCSFMAASFRSAWVGAGVGGLASRMLNGLVASPPMAFIALFFFAKLAASHEDRRLMALVASVPVFLYGALRNPDALPAMGNAQPVAARAALAFVRTTYLRNASLRGASLRRVALRWVRLQGADLTRADLSGADLSHALLTGARLGSADLTGACLHGASLSGADLRNARLTGTDLTGADLTGAVLAGAIHGPTTRWPEGYAPSTGGPPPATTR